MEIYIVDATYKGNYSFDVSFSDGVEGEVDLEPLMFGEVFKQIKDRDYIKKAFVDRTTRTLTWPNGIDLAPEAIRRALI